MKQILLGLCLLSVTGLQAQWNGDSTVNNAVATGPLLNSRSALRSVTDGSGGMWLAWEDTTGPSIGTDLVLQRINANGSLAFTSPLIVSDASGTQNNLSMVADGAGGVVLAWQDSRLNNRNDIYGQRFNAAGSPLWTAGGVPITDTLGLQTTPAIQALNATEWIVFYRTDLGGASAVDLYVQKINAATGAITSTARLINGGARTPSELTVLPDGVGGAFLVWEDPVIATTNSDIKAQRVNNSLDTLWAGTTGFGIDVCNAPLNQLSPSAVTIPSATAGQNDLVVAWGDNRGTDQGIYVQRISSAGAALWTANGVLAADATGVQSNAKLVAAGGEVIVAYGDNRISTGNRDVFAQKLNGAGAVQWAVNGVQLMQGAGNQPNSVTSGFVVLPDGANGAFVVVDDTRNGTTNVDVRAQRVNNAGAILWGADGAGLAVRTSNQNQPTAVADGAGGVIAAWRDSRTATGAEIYASRTNGLGILLPVEFTRVAAAPQGSAALVQWTVAHQQNIDKYIVERAADGVSFAPVGTVAAAERLQYQWVDAQPFATSYYRIKAVAKDGKISLSAVVKLQMKGAELLVKLFPNPVADLATVSLEQLKAGKYELRIVNANGQQLLQRRIETNGGTQVLQLNVSTLPNGQYFVQIVSDKGESVAVQSLQKN